MLLGACAASDVTPVVRQPRGTSAALERDERWVHTRLAIPEDDVLAREIAAALDLRRHSEFERALDAKEQGELLEHATMSQITLDRGIFGLDALFVVGDELFDYEFRPGQGLGNGLSNFVGAGNKPLPNMRRVHDGEFGAPESFSCATCHLKSGLDGAGTQTQNAFFRSDGDSTLEADERQAPLVLGMGPIQALAVEMSLDLQTQRRAAVDRARMSGMPATEMLVSKGIAFGQLTAQANGEVDVSQVQGVDGDLVVRPFGWKGHQASLRGIIAESFRIHMGLVTQSDQERIRDGRMTGALHGDGMWFDVDKDGVTLEIEDGMVTTLSAYLSQLEAPVIRPPQGGVLLDAFARGQGVLETALCTECHRPSLQLDNPVVEFRPDSVMYEMSPPLSVDVAHDGEFPKIEPINALHTAFNVALFSDLRRHDMGPGLASPGPQGSIPASVFLTRPLWGLAETSPYLHDGRAPTIDDAIRAHGGEAQASVDAYTSLSDEDRKALQIYLLSLTRTPKVLIP